MANRLWELALLNLGIDSKLRGCDLVTLKVRDDCHSEQIATRAIVMQQKNPAPGPIEITAPTRETLQRWIRQAGLRSETFFFQAGSTARRTSEPVSTLGS